MAAKLPLRANAAMAACAAGITRTTAGTSGIHHGEMAHLRSKISLRIARGSLASRAGRVLLAVALTTTSCSTLQSVSDSVLGGGPDPAAGTPGHVRGFLGGVAADEPQAALAARQILSAGGNAADAAVALGFALAVTLPSRAGLGGGGACLAFRAGKEGAGKEGGGAPEAIMFMATAPANAGASDRPVGLPAMTRGLFVLHARYGSRPFESLIAPAEQMARFGTPASRAFVRDLQVVAGPLSGDPGAREAFFPRGQPVAEGGTMLQPSLGATLSQIRIAGVGDLYQGALGRRLAAAAGQIGARITLDDLRAGLPSVVAPLTLPGPLSDRIAFLPPPADGGLAAAAAYQVLATTPGAIDQAGNRALAVAARWRRGGIDAAAVLQESLGDAALPNLPASTSYATLDQNGNAVVCAVSMGNLFGIGRVAPNTGVLLGASPAAMPPPLLSAAIAYNPNLHAFHAAVGGSGQSGAPLAVAIGLAQTLPDRRAVAQPNPGAVPEPGRANIIACSQYLPDADGSCSWATDPRGSGLAIGSN